MKSQREATSNMLIGSAQNDQIQETIYWIEANQQYTYKKRQKQITELLCQLFNS